MRRALVVGLTAVALGGCAVPGWVPWLGRSVRKPPPAPAVAAPPAPAARVPEVKARRLPGDASVTDRVVAVVNNDAITLGELQENIVAYQQENRQRAAGSEEELVRQFLTRLIDSRLQLQEADREKITVEDAEVSAALAERLKPHGVATETELAAQLKAQGLSLEAVKGRIRDSLRIARVIRRKVTLRVSVTDQEINRYLEDNRSKLETGLAYHARHVLVAPEGGADDAAWERARIKADLLRTQLQAGADFAELARQHSRDASARDGGDLGTLKRGELAQDIETEILRLAPGELSPPYRSSLGYHVFRLESKDALEGEGLARAKQQIREILFRQKYEARLDVWLKEIKERAIIEVRL